MYNNPGKYLFYTSADGIYMKSAIRSLNMISKGCLTKFLE